MSTLERPGKGLKRRLLPAAASLAVFEDLIASDDTVSIELERLALRCGPEHEGRVAVRSPGDGNRSIGHLVLHHTMLSQDRGWVSLSGLAVGHTDEDVVGR